MIRIALGCAVVLLGCENFDRLKQLKPRKVTLRMNDVAHAADGGTVLIPRPALNAPLCEAWVDVLLESGFQKFEGRWVADGQCELRDVLPGETMIRVPGGTNWITTTLDDVDFGVDYFGRAVDRAAADTTLTLDLSGAAPFSSTNRMSMYLPAFGEGLNTAYSSGLIGFPTGSNGQTSFPVTFNWNKLPLLAAGESTEVFQSVKQDVNPTTYRWALTKRGSATVVPVSGKTVRGAVTMTDVGTRAAAFPAVSFDPRPFFEAFKLEVLAPTFIGCFFDQDSLAPGAYNTLSVQSTFSIDEKATFSAPASTLDPLPGVAWTPRLSVAAFYDSAIGTRDKPPYGTLTLGSIFHGPGADFGWLPSASMTPVRNIKARMRRDGSTIGVGELDSVTPVLTWDAPATGVPNRYFVQPYQVTIEKDVVKFTRTADSVVVDRAEAHIPPDLLKAGSNYVFVVTADNCSASDAKRPRRLNIQSVCANTQIRSFLFSTPQ